MSVRFFLRAPSGQPTEITGPFRIGRDAECQIQVDNTLVSRIHASIWVDHDHLLLRDERSRNGTLLNGKPLPAGEAHYLHHGDEVRIGETTFVVESDQPFPRPRQHGGLPGLAEEEPPPTARLEGPPSPAPAVPAASEQAAPAPAAPIPAVSQTPAAAPAPALPLAGAAAAPPRRLPGLPVMLGGCLVLVLLALCCALGFFGATAGGPAILTALAPVVRQPATPAPASAVESIHALALHPDPIARDASLNLWQPADARGLRDR